MMDLASAVAQFTYTEKERMREETLRQQFLEKFPASGLASMKLEQYSLGLESTENSFCYWLEFKTKKLGSISGNTARKFVVFFDKKKGEYWFPDKYKSKEDAFASVKSGILELIRLGTEGRFTECESVAPLNTMNLFRGKILNMYFPDQFLAIFSLGHLKDYCFQFDLRADYDSQSSMNLALSRFKIENPLFSGWTNDKFASFLYEKFPPTVQFWKIAPGEKARFWNDCQRDGYMCIGWEDLGNLKAFTQRDALREAFAKQFPGNNRKWRELWDFANEIKEGDRILANNGRGTVVGIGTVTGKYWFNEERTTHQNCIPVDWDEFDECRIPPSVSDLTAQWPFKTVELLDRERFQKLISGEPVPSDTHGIHSDVQSEQTKAVEDLGRYADVCRSTFLPESFFVDCEQLLATKKQIVLQGAPGTGKTFVAEQLATLWAGDAERVKVVQFHESYGYEDFVHGLKPKLNPTTNRTAFVPTPGIFLRFCEEIEKDKTVPQPHYVLLIDEINRAKTARVFGELLYLLEYRVKEVELQNGTRFSIPPNLYIIGTMNTTDKSIALVDYALRRRFAFVDLVPVKNRQSVVLGKWLESNGISNATEVDDLFIALNDAIVLNQKDEALMVGHSYFMLQQAVKEKRFSPELLRFVWDYFIMPLIAEYEYQSTRAELEEKYGLAALREALK
jgi:5-methylcytosine-specific restriction protein B